jgi:hypothetical protein
VLIAACALLSSAIAQAATPEQIADYRAKLADYNAARAQYQVLATPYWAQVKVKRAARFAKRRAHKEIMLEDYVLTQPPDYTGPKKPIDPSGPSKGPVPVVTDFLRHAAEQFGFVPDRPGSEIDFKRAYARVAAAAGLTRDQTVRVYGFEATGNGKYDVQAGLEFGKPGEVAITTALGYNQLLATNSVELLAEQGRWLVDTLKARTAEASGAKKVALEKKLAILGNMIVFSRSVADDWNLHERLAGTPKGFGIHALNLDVDIGPLLQTQKLLTSIVFAKQRGYAQPLTAAELEMMNLTGDGNGFDMVSMSSAMREKVPTSNFFGQGGYERNPVARRNNTVAKLLAATDSVMDRESALPGAKDLAAAFDAR